MDGKRTTLTLQRPAQADSRFSRSRFHIRPSLVLLFLRPLPVIGQGVLRFAFITARHFSRGPLNPNWRSQRRFLDARAERAAGRARVKRPVRGWRGVLAKGTPPLRAGEAETRVGSGGVNGWARAAELVACLPRAQQLQTSIRRRQSVVRPNGKSAHTLLDKWSASRAIIKDRV